jgi:hypothetical protein
MGSGPQRGKHLPQSPGQIFRLTTFCITFYESYLSTAHTVSKNLTSSLGQNVNLASEMASHTHTPVQIVLYILENHTDLGRKKTLIIKVCTTPNIEV